MRGAAHNGHEKLTLLEMVLRLEGEFRSDLPPPVRPPVLFAHNDKPIGVTMRVSGAGGRYPSALCGRRVWY